jgi:hypothetical protein
MARRQNRRELAAVPHRSIASGRPITADQILEPPQETVLDVLDHLLNKGVMLNGDVTLGVAGIDLIYLRLSTLLCAADRILPDRPVAARSRRRKPRPEWRRRR